MKYERRIRIAIILGVVSLANVAAADDTPSAALASVPNDRQRQAEQLAQRAFEAHAKGDFAHAVALYVQAYQIAPSAALLYNTANIYDRKLKDPALALDFYRKYINASDADPELVLRSTARIGALNAELAAKPSAPATTREGASDAEAPTEPSRAWHTAGLVTVGAGVVGIGIGAIFGLSAQSKNSDSSAYCTGKTCTDPRGVTLRDEATSAATVSTVAFTLGAVAVAGGALMYVLAPSRALSKTGARVSPMVSGQVTGLQIVGSY